MIQLPCGTVAGRFRRQPSRIQQAVLSFIGREAEGFSGRYEMNGSFFRSLPENAAPPTLYVRYPEIYLPWSEMSEALMNGASPLSQGERELIFAYAAGLEDCEFVYIAHSEVAYAWGVERGLLDKLLQDPANASVEARMRPMLEYVRKLTLTPADVSQVDADAVFDAGWEELALHHAIAITGRAAFMVRLAQGFGFRPLSRETAARHARKRIDRGYVGLYPQFRQKPVHSADDGDG